MVRFHLDIETKLGSNAISFKLAFIILPKDVIYLLQILTKKAKVFVHVPQSNRKKIYVSNAAVYLMRDYCILKSKEDFWCFVNESK